MMSPLRAVSQSTRRAQVLAVIVLSAIAAPVALWTGRASTLSPLDTLLLTGFVVSFFAMRLLCIRLPQGDVVCITLMAGLTALGVLDIGPALAASAAAGILDAVARLSQSSRDAAVKRLIDTARGTAVLALVSPWQVIVRPWLDASHVGDAMLLPVAAAGLTYAALDIITVAIHERIAGGPSVIQGIALLLRPLASVYLVHMAMAAVVLRVYPELGLWGFAIALLLTIILQNSFNLYLRIRRAYAETISALAHAAELDRPQDSGHARRVADLSIAVARRMGLAGTDLEHVGYAALLHDIGRIGHTDESAADHARRGAEIVAPIPFLAAVAPLIAEHRETDKADVPLGSAIVGVCSRYDRLRSQHGARLAVEMMLEQEQGVRRSAVETLGRIIDAQQASGGSAS